MAWLSSLPTGIVVSVDNYPEFREKPGNPNKQQYRDHAVTTTEYRGVTLNAAQEAVNGYPIVSSSSQKSRSLQAIGGGGYNVIEIEDAASFTWTDIL